MGRSDEPMPWTVETNTHLTDYVVAGYHDLKDAQKHRAETLRVHRDGWNAVASAIATGLGQIAKAISDTRR